VSLPSLLAEARNPYVANLIELNEDGGVHYLVQEFVPGKTLARLIVERGRLEELHDWSDIKLLTVAVDLDREVEAVLAHCGFTPATAEVTQRAATSLELSGETAEAMVHLLEALEGLDEVRDVYSNVEISDEVLARI